MVPTKKMTPHVPITPNEIIKEVLNSVKYGVSIVHLHARDPKTGLPTYKKEVYAKIIKGIRKKNKEIILCASTSGRNFNEFNKRSAVMDLKGDAKPDMASLTLSSLNFPRVASVNSPEMIMKLAAKMKANNIKPELEVFDIGMVNYAKYLIKKKLIEPPYYFNIILGNIANAQADFTSLGHIIKELPEDSYYSLGGIGNSQYKMNCYGVLSEGGIRIGLEDNIFFDSDRKKLASNEDFLKRIKNFAKLSDRKIAKPKEARKILGI